MDYLVPVLSLFTSAGRAMGCVENKQIRRVMNLFVDQSITCVQDDPRNAGIYSLNRQTFKGLTIAAI